MAGTLSGGRLAARKNKRKYGADFYARIGTKGGKKRNHNKGFGSNPELARIAGAEGGSKSRRGPGKSPRYYYFKKASGKWIADFPGVSARSFRTEAEARIFINKLKLGVQDVVTEES